MKKLFLFCLVFSANLFAQQVGDWKNFTSMKSINTVKTKDNVVWCATNGGIFSYNTTDSTYNKLTKSEGLSSQTITALTIDDQNKIWIGTQDGTINVYDPSTGNIKKILDIYNSDKSKKQINHLTSRNDTIFVSSDFGVSLINSKTYFFIETIIKFGTFSSDTKINSLTAGKQIYVALESGIAVNKAGTTNLSAPESWNVYSFQTQDKVTSINKVLFFNNLILVATDKGIFKLENNILSLYESQISSTVDLLVKNEDLYALTGGKIPKSSLVKLNSTGSSIIFSTTQDSLKTIEIDGNNSYYFSTLNGLLALKDGATKLVYPDGPFNNSFQSITVDNDGNLWSATGRDGYGVGILKYSKNNWFVYNKNNTPAIIIDDYQKIYSSNNTIFACNWGRGFTKIENNLFTTFTASNTALSGIPDHPLALVITDIENDNNNNTWILNLNASNKKPLSVLLTDSTWYHYDFALFSLVSDATFYNLAIDQYNTKWFSIFDKQPGLYYFNENNTFDNTSDDTWGAIKETDGLNSNIINCITVDNRGEIWVGTSLGANIIRNPASPKVGITSVFPIRQQSATCIAVDPLDRKWVGTNQGVFLLSSDGSTLIEQYDIKNSPIASNDIKSIAFDNKNGIVYIGTDYGLSALYTTAVEPLESFNDIFVYPNPFCITEGQDIKLTIDGLVKDSNIKIFSLAGILINQFASPGGKIAFWDGKDLYGKYVASGIYLITAYDNEANNVKVQKVAVLRK
ncbi:MAG: two-component regulator propeller domain-containing protein [bacterium]